MDAFCEVAPNGLCVTVMMVLSEGSAQTGLLRIDGGGTHPRKLLFSTPEVAIEIGKAMLKDWGWKEE